MFGKKFAVLLLVLGFMFAAVISAQDGPKKLMPSGDDGQKLFNYAEALFNVQQYQDAIVAYLQVIYLSPKGEYTETAQYKLAEALFRKGDRYVAIGEWKKLMEKNPESPLALKAKEHVKLAEIVTQNEEQPTWNMEDQVCSKYISFAWDFLDRSNKSTNIGVVYNQGELDKAIYWLNKIITEYPDSQYAAQAQFILGECSLRQSKQAEFEKAIIEYQKVINKYPGTTSARKAYIKIGDVYKDNIRSQKKAIEAYQKAIDALKGDPNSYYVAYAQTQIVFLK